MIRILTDEDIEAFVDLRREALLDSPLAFASSPDDDFASDPSAVRDQIRLGRTVIFGAFDDRLVAVAGLYRDRHVKSSHKIHLWGMYTRPTHRRRGLGAELVRAAVLHADSLAGIESVHLGVSSTALAARQLYEAAGFRSWGTEPDALRHEGEAVSLHHMVLDLRGR